MRFFPPGVLLGGAEPLKVGSKRFTESYILGEIIVKAAGDAVHRQGLGNTGIVFAALKAGSIDLYPEYTGTIAKEILKLDGNPGLAELNRALAPLGWRWRCRSASTTAMRWRCARSARRRSASARSAISRSIRRSSSACRRNSSAAPTAGRG